MSVVKELPQVWSQHQKNTNGSVHTIHIEDDTINKRMINKTDRNEINVENAWKQIDSDYSNRHQDRHNPKTPIHILVNGLDNSYVDNNQSSSLKLSKMKSRQSWSSSSLPSSPTDQLIAAILDGDVQGAY